MRQLSPAEAASTGFEKEEEEERKRVPAFPFSLEDRLELDQLAERFLPLRYVTEDLSQSDRIEWEGQQAIPSKAGVKEKSLYKRLFVLEAKAVNLTGKEAVLAGKEAHATLRQLEMCWRQRHRIGKVAIGLGLNGDRSAATTFHVTTPYYLRTVRQVAVYLDWSYGKARRLIERNDFPGRRPFEAGWVIKADDLDAWLAQSKPQPENKKPLKPRRPTPDWRAIQQLIKEGKRQAGW